MRSSKRAIDPRPLAFLLCAASLLGARVAAAQENSIAEQLFLEGRALMKEERYLEACPKLRASFDLDKTATGTLLNLALCHEKTDRLASAWAEYGQVAAESAGRREDRVTHARERQAALFPRLAHVRIVVPAAARIRELGLVLDEQPIVEASWETDLPVDAGHHTLRAAAPSYLAASTTFDIVDGERREVVVPTLSPDPSADAVAAPVATPGRTARRVAGFAIGAGGLVAVGVGLAFGARASSASSEADDLCPNRTCATEADRATATERRDSARSSADISTVVVATGGVLLGVGLVLVLTALPISTPPASKTSLRLGGCPGRTTGFGLCLEGSL